MSEAEDLLGKDRIAWERANYRPTGRPRLTLDDFSSNGVNIVKKMMEGLERIEDPEKYMKNFFEMLSFVTPKVATIDIQHEVNASGNAKIDMNALPTDVLVKAMRELKE